MPTLRNPRHEAFARALFQGETADQAYMTAGYSANRGNASRLKANENILARLGELQEAVAKDSAVTVASLLSELEDARVKASNLDQLSAAVRAIEAKAKVSGLLVQKLEVGNPNDFSKCETVEEVVNDLLTYSLNQSYETATQRDKEGLVALYERHFEEVEQVLSAIKARPIAGVRLDGQRRLNGNGQRR